MNKIKKAGLLTLLSLGIVACDNNNQDTASEENKQINKPASIKNDTLVAISVWNQGSAMGAGPQKFVLLNSGDEIIFGISGNVRTSDILKDEKDYERPCDNAFFIDKGDTLKFQNGIYQQNISKRKQILEFSKKR